LGCLQEKVTLRSVKERQMRLAIDASNIRAGGGVTHLIELLRAADPARHGIERIFLWAPSATLARIEDRPWLEKRSDPALDGNLLKRIVWQRWKLDELIEATGADLLLVPGGSIITNFRPVVTMSRNMVPFEWKVVWQHGFSPYTLRALLLRWNQSASFKRADGTIFLTRYAYDAITTVTGPLQGKTAVVPHGIDTRFRLSPRPQRMPSQFSPSDPLRVVYVSTVEVFKHQWLVVEAVGRLRNEGLPIHLDLYGSARAGVLPRLTKAISRVDPQGEFVRYWGEMDYREIHKCYAAADVCVFASSCENMPNILIESMAAGLPIACSERGPMPEVLGDAGVYFDPEEPASIADAVRQLALDPGLRAEKAAAASHAASQFSWSRCADETFDFLASVAAQQGVSEKACA
jgi:glycosyltransferase involved in cell wall biosynthesis